MGEKWSDPGASGALCPAIFRDGQDCGSIRSVGDDEESIWTWSCPPDSRLQMMSKPVDMQVKGFCTIWDKETSMTGTHPHPLGAPPDQKP